VAADAENVATATQPSANRPDDGESPEVTRAVGRAGDWVREATSVWKETWSQLPAAEKTKRTASAITEEIYRLTEQRASLLKETAQSKQGDDEALEQVLRENLTAVRKALMQVEESHISQTANSSDESEEEAGGCAGSAAAPTEN